MFNFTRSISQLGKIRRREKLVILAVLMFCFLFGFFGTLFVGKNLFYLGTGLTGSSSPVITPAPANLNLQTSSKNLKVGDNFDITINLASKDLGVEAADFVVIFDPSFIKPVSITNGNFFKNYPLKKINSDFIKISAIASYVNNKIIIPQGSGTVASIRFTALSATPSAQIAFDPAKTIVAHDGRNIIGQMLPQKVSITQNQ